MRRIRIRNVCIRRNGMEWSSSSSSAHSTMSGYTIRATETTLYIVHLYAVSRAFFMKIKYVYLLTVRIRTIKRESEREKKIYWINNAFWYNVRGALVRMCICVLRVPRSPYRLSIHFDAIQRQRREISVSHFDLFLLLFVPFGNILVLSSIYTLYYNVCMSVYFVRTFATHPSGRSMPTLKFPM